ncbi:hypothetical protein LXA19_18130, partial [Erwinia amylovora]|uniref:hypothetical protein n=1 Tax=Erwinia amylovora TaxID=552 RepID=UPI0020BFE03B
HRKHFSKTFLNQYVIRLQTATIRINALSTAPIKPDHCDLFHRLSIPVARRSPGSHVQTPL